MSNDTVRAFIAIELNEALRRQLEATQTKLRTSAADVKWVEPKNIHLTLKFLGDVPKEKLDDLCAAIENSISGFKKFEFQVNGLGCFPLKGTPRIIWAEVGLGDDLLSRIVGSLEKYIRSFCEEKDDKKFSPHVTLGRVRSNKNISNLAFLLKQDIELREKQIVDHITLFQSDLSPSGPIYSIIKSFKLM